VPEKEGQINAGEQGGYTLEEVDIHCCENMVINRISIKHREWDIYTDGFFLPNLSQQGEFSPRKTFAFIDHETSNIKFSTEPFCGFVIGAPRPSEDKFFCEPSFSISFHY
jgi:hypothetical protein